MHATLARFYRRGLFMLQVLKALGFAALVVTTIVGFIAFAIVVMLAGMWLTGPAPGATFEVPPKPSETRPSHPPATAPGPLTSPEIPAS